MRARSVLPSLHRPVAVLAILALVAAVRPSPASAQERVHPVSEGDGRIHGAPVIPVTNAELHPGQVQTVNLHPRYHAILEFPYPVARIDAGDPDVFAATIVGNKVTLKATKVTKSETSMSIILGDADLTVVPFLIRADSTQPFVYVVRYTDPVAKHLNQAEAQIAARLRSDEDGRVSELAEARLQQRLLLAGDVVRIGKTVSVGHRGERFGVTIESAQQLPGDDGKPRLYVRYRVLNQTVAPLSDLYFVPRVTTTTRHLLLFSRTTAREVYDAQDVRATASVPPGASAYGLLIFDDLDLRPNEALSLEAVGFNGQRRVRVDRVLVGHSR